MKKKQAISLIVLVITIIVMIVLAGAIILTLSNSGIINQASNAVDRTNEAQIKQIVQLGWAEAYAEHGADIEKLKAGVDAIIEKNNIDVSEYGIAVTTSGVKVVKGWVQEGLTVKKGDQVRAIGDVIEYDETAGGTIEGLKDVNWQILGASDEGELLILSTYETGLSYNGSNELKNMQNKWLNAVDELDELCKPYGQGTNAVGARSIRVEDVDKVTGFDKTTQKYGMEVTYSYNGTTKPLYTSSDGSGTLGDHSNGFHYYNGTEFITADLSTTSGTITTLKDTAYSYYASELENVDTTSNAYKMLFFDSVAGYLLASPYVMTGVVKVYYGLQSVVCEQVCSAVAVNMLNGAFTTGGWNSDGEAIPFVGSVRVVVALSPTVNLTAVQDGGWKY